MPLGNVISEPVIVRSSRPNIAALHLAFVDDVDKKAVPPVFGVPMTMSQNYDTFQASDLSLSPGVLVSRQSTMLVTQVRVNRMLDFISIRYA